MNQRSTQIERFDRYILGQMSDSEKAAFESELDSNPDLKEEFQSHARMVKGVNRLALRKAVNAAHLRFKGLKLIKWIGGLSALSLAIVFALNQYEGDTTAFEYNENNEKMWTDADVQVPSHYYTIDPNADTVIETPGGIVVSISDMTFHDRIGDIVTDDVQIEIKEALDPFTIVSSGLSTTSNGALLETGGMFYINARKGDESLNISEDSPIVVDLPASANTEGMMLFDGVREGGSINWVNPQSVIKTLQTVPLDSLNFLPQCFLDRLTVLGYDLEDQETVDSLFYAYSGNFRKDSTVPYWSSVYQSEMTKDTTFYTEELSITPAQVKTLYNQEFQNTFVATHQFEERLQEMYLACPNSRALLNAYMSRLDWPLSRIDSLVVENGLTGSNQSMFEYFASRGDGRVDMDNSALIVLNNYFEEKSRLYNEAISEAVSNYWNEQQSLTADLDSEISRNELETRIARDSGLAKEIDINITEAYRQLGKPRPMGNRTSRGITVNVTTTGWKNVDRYVVESTVSRTTLDYTDGEGRQAIIRYDSLRIKCDTSTYDRVYAYLLPEELNSYLLMTPSRNGFGESLDELLNYDLVVLAFKGEQTFYSRMEDVTAGAVSVNLRTKPLSEIQSIMNSGYGTEGGLVAKHIELQKALWDDMPRRKHNYKLMELRNDLRRLVFPCQNFADSIPESMEITQFN
ncbi:MAG: hypothetical protein HWD92_01430 [Flavobacteriia bacterium]|nr:hypothetical protein [Flavobacteriia bacterium]